MLPTYDTQFAKEQPAKTQIQIANTSFCVQVQASPIRLRLLCAIQKTASERKAAVVVEYVQKQYDVLPFLLNIPAYHQCSPATDCLLLGMTRQQPEQALYTS